MNERQKLVQQRFLNNEQAVIKELNKTYNAALREINGNIKKQMERFDPDTGDLPQSAVYQLKYQNMLKDQVEGVLGQLQTKQFLSISDYLDTCYNDGFIGALFDLHGQDIPLMLPIDQTKVVRAVQLDSKISKGLYTRLGEDVDKLKTRITAQVSRSILTGASYEQTARQLAMESRIGYNNAIRIARTEGHRVQCEAAYDAMLEAKKKGADVLKQWDATLDMRTRDSHAKMDGEIKELEEKFSNGLMFPGDPKGAAAEVVNCRCALLQRARWALDDEELQTLKDRAKYFGLDKTVQFDTFKKNYLKAAADEAVEHAVLSPAAAALSGANATENIADGIENPVNSGMIEESSPVFSISSNQFGKKVGRHAKDYGLNPASEEDREQFLKIVNDVIADSTEKRIGFWRGQPEDVFFFIKGNDVVVTKQNGEFITILKGGISNERVKNARIRKI